MILLKKEHFVLIFSIGILLIVYFFNGFFEISYIRMIFWNFFLILLISIGISTSAKTNNLNLGNEGQIYFGAFFAYVFSNIFDLSYFNFVFIIFLTSFSVGLIGVIPFLLKHFFCLNGMLTTLLMSYGNQRLVDGFISEFLNKDTFLIQTKNINEIFNLESSLSYLLVFAVLVWGAYVFIYTKTIIGLKLKVLEDRKKLGKFFNINEFKYGLASVFNSAFLNGLVGAFFIIFFKYYLFFGITSGLGWTGFIVSILSGFNFIYIIFFSFFFSVLSEFNNYLKINYEFKYELLHLYQALSIFIALFLIRTGRK